MTTAPQAAPSRCPRCGGSFDCGAASPGPCACTGLVLSQALQQQLRRQYTGCLCLPCLRELAQRDGQALQSAP